MAFDYSKLRGKITEIFGTQVAFAKAMGVSERTLSCKLNSRVPFTQPEMARIAVLLHIDTAYLDMYFFAPKVQEVEPTKEC
jgi:transcriptional regulator with XRE-family HTH domain